jgi:hypothetical protein
MFLLLLKFQKILNFPKKIQKKQKKNQKAKKSQKSLKKELKFAKKAKICQKANPTIPYVCTFGTTIFKTNLFWVLRYYLRPRQLTNFWSA